MDKETLFNDILDGEQIVLFAGAGLSRYAGYPMGAEVVKHLYAALSTTEKQTISTVLDYHPEVANWPIPKLPDFARAFVNIQNDNRHKLYSILLNLFDKEASAIYAHEKLALVSNFKHIITTNYDHLFEIALKTYRPVTSSNGLPYIRENKPTLYKIHGNFHDMNGIIITGDDFVQFFERADEGLWGHLKSLMTRYTIIFVGYAVEDPNVRSVILEIKKRLGENMKPAYVVGPSSSDYTIKELSRHNMCHINMTGEAFADELFEFLNLVLPAAPMSTQAGPHQDTGFYASQEVKKKLGQPGPGRFFAIDDSIRLVELDLNGHSENDSDSLKVECKIAAGLTIKPEVMNPSTEDLHTSIEHFDDKIRSYLKNQSSFRYIEPESNKPLRKSEWKIGLDLVELPVDTPKKKSIAITIRPLTYLATELFNRRVVRAKAADFYNVEHDFREVVELYEAYATTLLGISEPITPESYQFSFPSQLFVEVAVLTSDKKVMLVRKTAGTGAGVVAEVGRAWTCGPEFGLTFNHLQDNNSILLHAAIAEGLKTEFGISSDKIKSWHIDGLCLPLIHLNTALYGYCIITMNSTELVESFRRNKSKQFDSTVEPELIELSDIPKILSREKRHDGFSWHPTAKIRLHSLLRLSL